MCNKEVNKKMERIMVAIANSRIPGLIRMAVISAVTISLLAAYILMSPLKAASEAVYIVPAGGGGGGGNALVYQSVKDPNAVITKPTCSSGNPYIFVMPVYMVGGITTNIYPITGISTFAVDNGATWTVKAQVKDSRDQLFENPLAIRTIVQVWCCESADCSI